ncbi:PD-(D/E)XK nuclease family protein [Aeoliella mucimassa]|uniref:DNA 3'-5' helicase II n=1 Tax=Aeoliella mucimassa TaxID=2527972 RepID=A0A518ATI7_9BACT|nr:PD-(D/E)XK nuclease family protein [Aeoliella mucimassa]QDU58041.1 ATP-dependent helicase/deoxyribonuclease subunit B [Aeoliella mucimassa]
MSALSHSEATTAQLHLIEHPSRVPATRLLVGRYAASLSHARGARQVARLLWITPHRLSADAVRRQLVESNIDASLEPGIKTLSRLAESIVSMDPTAPAVVPNAASRWLVEQAIAELHQSGKLRVLAGVAQRSGLADAVEQMIGQLKTRGITAGRFATWAKHKRRSNRDRELAAVLSLYQQRLDEAHAADRFDLTRLAADCLASTKVEQRWDLVVVDGFASFAYYERQLLLHLAQRAGETYIALPTLDQAERRELVSTARRTKQWLVDEWPSLEVTEHRDPDASPSTALEHLADQVFVPPDQAAPPEQEALATLEQLQVISSADSYDEAVTIARRIKSLLNAKVSASEILVVVPNLQAERRRLDEVLQVYGVPASFTVPATLGEAPAIRALGSLLSITADDWPFRRVLALVSSGLFGLFDGELEEPPWRTLRGAAEWLVRDLQIATGRESLLRAVRAMAAASDKAKAAGERPSDRQAVAATTLTVFEKLNQACMALPSTASPREWVAACERLARAVGLVLEPRQPSAWQAVREAAAWIERVAVAASVPLPRWSASDWLAQLNDWAERVSLAKPLDEEGRVRVVPVSVARFAHARHVFVVGMDEQAFSSAIGGGGLYSEQRYDEMVAADSSGRAVSATPAHERTMQAFHSVVTAASESLTFSYAALDGSGQSTPASPMLIEACRTFGDQLLGLLEATPRISPLPPDGAMPSSFRDWRLSAVHEADQQSPKLLASLIGSELAEPMNRSLVDSLELLHHRARGDSFGPMEGVLSSEKVRRWFADRYGPDHQWSTSQLETYATCPYKFLMQNVLRIQPLGEATLAVDYGRRGSILHSVFSELHQRLDLIARDLLLSQHPEAEYEKHLASAIHLAKLDLTNFGLEGVLNELLVREITKWARKYREQHVEYDARSRDFDEPMRPTQFEWRFGKASRESDDEESEDSTDVPYTLDLGDGMQVLLGGRIDRLDTGKVHGTDVLQVIDYKSASKHPLKEEEMTSGRKLQPPLYALAAAELLSTREQPIVPLKAGYWVLRDKGFADHNTQELYVVQAGQVAATKDWQRLDEAIRERIRELVFGVRAAEFPMVNTDDKCTSACDLSHVCRVAQTRSLGKAWPPIQDDTQEATDGNA